MTLTSAAAPSAFGPSPLEKERAFGLRERFISYDEVHDQDRPLQDDDLAPGED